MVHLFQSEFVYLLQSIESQEEQQRPVGTPGMARAGHSLGDYSTSSQGLLVSGMYFAG